MTRRHFLISTIESVFPLDSKCSDTRQTAERILNQLGVEASKLKDWRSLPIVTLYQYAEACAEIDYDSEMLAQWYKEYEALLPMTYSEWTEKHQNLSYPRRPSVFRYEIYLRDF